VDCREFVPGRVTGIGRFLRDVLAEIAGSRPRLRTVAVAGPGNPIPVAAPHLEVVRLPSRPTLYWDQVLLPRALRAARATAFFSPYYKAPMAAPCPTVVTIHDVIPLRFPEYTRGGYGRLYAAALRSWASWLARRAAAVVTDSEFSKGELLAELGLAPERVHVIYLGARQEFRPAASREAIAAATARYGIEGPYLLAVGNFLPHKNLPRLVEAYGSLPRALRERTRLVLAGTPGGHGPARPVPPAALAWPGVVLPGFIAAEDLPLVYAGAVAVACPSLVEGFGYTPLEAMACGTPVVCARAGALPEVAGDAALYVDPSDVASIAAGLRRILEEAPLRRELADRGLARARRFDPSKTVGRLVDLLEGVAAGRGAA
jgi:glycosyltransferase involved in cell wall biosynthesis